MSLVWTLWTLGSKGQRSRSQCKDYQKRILAHNCFPFYTYLDETSHAVSPWVEYGPYGLWGQKVKGQGHNARITENGFLRITASPLHLSLWNFTCSLPMSQVSALWNLGSKGQRSRSQCKDYWKWFLAHKLLPFYTYLYETSHAVSPWVEYGPYGLWGQKVKGQGHNVRIYWKRFLAHKLLPLYTYLHETSHAVLPMSRVWTLWTLGSKGQRSRSQCKDYWKWFLAHNCFPIWCITWIVWIGWPRGVFCPVRTAPF